MRALRPVHVGAALALLASSACVSPKDDDPGPAGDGALHLSLGAIETVVVARWETDAPTRSEVVASFEGGEIVVSEAEATTAHEVRLAGIPPLTDVAVRVSTDGADDVEATVRTGPLPPWVPDFAYSGRVPTESEGGFRIAPVIMAAGGGIVALDDVGRVVWSWPPEDSPSPVSPFRARLSRDKTAVLFNEPAASTATPGRIWRVALDGSAVETTPIDTLHTDFVEFADGGYAGLGWDIRDVGDGRMILGDTIREVSPDGVEREVWSVWDSFEPDLDVTYPGIYPADPGVEDWTHINGLSYDEETDSYYVTMTWNNAVLQVDRQTGELVWWISDFQGGDFGNADMRARIEMPHSVQRIDGGITVFSRGNPENPESCSAAVDIALDETAWESRETWRYAGEGCLLVSFLGSAERLPGGNTLIAWTTAGRITEVTPEGAVAWQVSTALGAAIGFSEQVPRLGP